jgi:hypothetical protein
MRLVVKRTGGFMSEEKTYLCRHCLTVNKESELVRHKKIKGWDRVFTDNIKACKNCKTGVFYN